MEQKRTGLSYVFTLAKEERGKLSLGMLLAVFSSALSFVPYLVVYQILLLIIKQEVTLPAMLGWAGIGIAAAVLQAILTSFAGICSHTAAFNTMHRIKVRVLEHIQMITEKNNMHDFDTSMFFRWIFKSAFAILIVSNTWNIVMGVFDATQSVVNQSSGVIIGETSIHFDRLIPGLEFQLESMTIGSLLSLWFQTLVVGLTMNILSICIFLVTYGRMIEIYVVTALGPIPLATIGSSEWRSTGQNYLKSLLALGFQAFLIMIVVGIYAVLIRNISGAADIAGAIWGCMGYTVLLCFCLFKTGSISKSVFGAH